MNLKTTKICKVAKCWPIKDVCDEQSSVIRGWKGEPELHYEGGKRKMSLTVDNKELDALEYLLFSPMTKKQYKIAHHKVHALWRRMCKNFRLEKSVRGNR